jgi:hypothetical protein
MGAPRFKKTISEVRRQHSRLFKRFKAGEVARVCIVQEKGTGRVLVAATNYEVAARELEKQGLTDAEWDIADFTVES